MKQNFLRCACRPGEALSLQRIEYLLGDQVFLEMLSGKHPYLTAAMKSLPLEEGGPLKIQPGDPVADQERRLAERLIGTCEEIMEGVFWTDGSAHEVLRCRPNLLVFPSYYRRPSISSGSL